MIVNEHTTKDVQGQGPSNINLVCFFDVYQPSHGNVVFFLLHKFGVQAILLKYEDKNKKGIVRKKKRYI